MDRRIAGYSAMLGVAIFIATTATLHVVQPTLDPLREAVSYYVHGAWGWMLTLGLIALGVGSIGLTFGLTDPPRGRGARTGRWLIGMWGGGVLLGGIFPADPPGRWNEPPSIPGMIHGQAAMLAFLVLPVGALLLARAAGQDERWRPERGRLLALAIATAVSLALFAASLTPVFVRPGPPILLGLSERILLAAYSAWIVTAAAGLIRARGRAPDASL
jgi:hypothetical protein